MRASTHTEPAVTGSLSLDIANALVAIHKELHGQGPTRARATLTQDLLVVTLEGGYTQVERQLHEHARDDAVKAGRRAIQDAAGARIIETIEALTGRRVRSYMSGHDPGRELQAEVFVLEPEEPRESPPAG